MLHRVNSGPISAKFKLGPESSSAGPFIRRFRGRLAVVIEDLKAYSPALPEISKPGGPDRGEMDTEPVVMIWFQNRLVNPS
jgi:hypothetical protein